METCGGTALLTENVAAAPQQVIRVSGVPAGAASQRYGKEIFHHENSSGYAVCYNRRKSRSSLDIDDC